MKVKIHRYLTLLLSFLMLSVPNAVLAANYQWIQNDWRGGPSLGGYAQHDALQNGRYDWTIFYLRDPTVIDQVPQGLTLSNLPDLLRDTNFQGVIKDEDNVEVGVTNTGARFLKMRNYPLDVGNGTDGSLIIDGKTAGNSTGGMAHPRIVDTPANLNVSTDLSPGGSGTLSAGSYYYRVVAYNSAGESVPISKTYTHGYNNRSIVLTWDAVACADGYRIYGRGKPPGTFGLLKDIAGETTTTYRDTGADIPDPSKLPGEHNTSDGAYLSSGDKNYSDITVQNCGGVSAPGGTLLSPPSNVTVSPVSGSGPAGTFSYVVTAFDSNGLETGRSSPEKGITGSGGNAISITWSPVTGASGYKVYRRSSSGAFASPALLCTTTSTSCTDSGGPLAEGVPPLDTATIPAPNVIINPTGGEIPDGTYYYALTAVDHKGFETTYGPQRSVSVSYGTNTASLDISWPEVPGASGYRIYRTTTSGRYNSPALICDIGNPAILFCKDTFKLPLEGAPTGNYYNAMIGGMLNLKVSNILLIKGRGAIHMDGKGYPGGDGMVNERGGGKPGKGPGAGISYAGGGGYGSTGLQNSSNTGMGGNPYGDALMTIPYAGSGGASGSSTVLLGVSGKGGGGGGTIKIAANILNMESGGILSDGERGENILEGWTYPGGGGSGGSVILGGNTINLTSGTLSASGGLGGSYEGTVYRDYDRGGKGGGGRIRIASYNPIPAIPTGFGMDPTPLIGNEGTYSSNSFELDTGGVSFTTFSWDASVPSGSTLRFQIATNRDNSTWKFVGPDGTAGSYYSASDSRCNTVGNRSTCQIYSGHNGDRYLKYKAYFKAGTVNPNDSPLLNEVSVNLLKTQRVQSLVSSPYDTTNPGNSINRWQWSENIIPGSDVGMQIRTCPGSGPTNSVPCAPDAWGSWLGPHSTTFSAPSGSSQITVASASGFTAGSRVTLTDAAEAGLLNPTKFEAKKIVSISGNTMTLDSSTAYTYGTGSILSDVYTDPNGTEAIHSAHRDGAGDRWLQYRIYLFSDDAQGIPQFLESNIGYRDVGALYQPDGIIEGNGNVDPPRSQPYAPVGSGGGGVAARSTNMGTRIDFKIEVQNDGTVEGIDDRYTLVWNRPSDLSGTWTVVLSDGVNDYPSPYTTPAIPAGSSIPYTLKVTPSPNAPAASTKDVILDIRSISDYARGDSIKATVNINTTYSADGLIDGNGDNLYDPCTPACSGSGGASLLKEGGSGDTILYSVTLQNEGNLADTYKFSLSKEPPAGWTVLINDGSRDYDITNPSNSWTTPSIPPPPDSGSSVTYTLKVIPKGSPVTADLILNIYSNGGMRYVDSLTARLNLKGIYKVDGAIYGFGYDASGTNAGVGILGAGCGAVGAGDNVYGALGTGGGGCTAIDIPAGSSRVITVGVQNEGNVPDRYQVSWITPTGWGIVPVENGALSSPLTAPGDLSGNPPASGLCPDNVNRCYLPGEMPFFTFKITSPPTFASGSQTILFDIQSSGDAARIDSVKAVINSRDTTPPASVALSAGNITSTSVTLSWTAPGDDGTSGTAASYDLRYATSPILTDAEFTVADRVRSCGKPGESNLNRPKTSGGSESCTVSQLFANTDYYFALKTSDDAGNASSISTCSGCPAHTLISNDATKPGVITDLAVTDATENSVTLCWTAPADDSTDSSSGPVTAYRLRHSTKQIIESGLTPGAGQVAFINATLITPAGGWLPPKAPGEKECYRVPVENKIDTGGGVIEDRTRNTRFYFALKAQDEARNTSGISNVVGAMTPLVPYAYNMVSVPYAPNPATPQDVLGDDVGAPLRVYWWDSRGPNFDSGCYEGEPGPYSSDPAKYACLKLTAIKEGLGYFLWVPPKSVILDAPPASTQPTPQSCVDDAGNTFSCYVMPLQEGWNMTGAPFDKENNFTSRDVNGNGIIESAERGIYVRRTSGSKVEVATFQDAVTAKNWIDGSIYTYNGVHYTYEVCEGDKTGETLGTRCSLVMQPWKAYWIRLHVLGGATFELLIPY